MQNEVRDFVIDYFREKGLPDINTVTELLSYNYLDKGIIDSFGIVEMIVSLEEEFGVTFPPEEMQKEEFGTVGGLIDIVESLSNGEGK
ncbi:phosphopantetheine-binding protein [Candidatus Poribacteria bacterium]